MKKILFNLFLFASIASVLISCEGANTEPVGSVVKEISIVEPSNGANLVLSANFANQTATTIKWSGADFGYSAAVKYTLQIALDADADYVNAKTIDLGSFHEKSTSNHEFAITHKNLNLILTSLGGVIANSVNFRMKIVGNPDVQLTDPTDPASYPNALFANSQEITFSATVYDKFDETLKIYVPGNFGAASTFADWNVDVNGTSNSPVIYKPLETQNEYNGFVYMNNAVPQFKFANPDATNLNLKGLNTAAATLANLYSGTIKDVSDIIDPSNITIPAGTPTTTGAGTYYITADLVANTYSAIKRKISISGPTVRNTAKVLIFETDATSPYYRMYVAKDIVMVSGLGYIQVKDFSSANVDLKERFGLDNGGNPNLIPGANVKNKLKLGGSQVFNVNTPGTFTIVLDTKNSANYNLRLIPN